MDAHTAFSCLMYTLFQPCNDVCGVLIDRFFARLHYQTGWVINQHICLVFRNFFSIKKNCFSEYAHSQLFSFFFSYLS